MITKAHIVPTLHSLNAAYNAALDPDAERIAKLAIIELCGWIEESMDGIVLRCGNRHLRNQKNIDSCKNQVVGLTYGFEYGKHFRNMLVQVIGLIGVEKLEQRIDQNKNAVMKSSLGTLKSMRDLVAHTHIKGTARTLSAPSVMISNFNNVYDGLFDIDQKMRTGGW